MSGLSTVIGLCYLRLVSSYIAVYLPNPPLDAFMKPLYRLILSNSWTGLESNYQFVMLLSYVRIYSTV